MVLALVGVNVVSNRVAPESAYVPLAILTSAALLAFARRVDGRSWFELGLAPDHFRRGLAWAGVLAGSIVVIFAVGYWLPFTHDLFEDERVRDWSFGHVLFAAFVRVPLGTVLLEEVTFRSVLPAVVGARAKRWVAVAVSAGLFGLWHILPSLGLLNVNPVAEQALGADARWITVVLSVISTALVGVWFWWLRHRSQSLLAPIGLHWATNGLGYLFAYAAWNH